MRDRRFTIAVFIIILLVLLLVYVMIIGPKIQGYMVRSQIEAQKSAVNTIVQIVNQQGYIVLGDGDNAVVLVKYQIPAKQQNNQVEVNNNSTGS